jgi:photosystem II stability/assembly factor-like uncharacterized protein
MTKTLRTALASQLLVWMCLLSTVSLAQDFWKPTGGPLGQTVWEMLVTANGTYYAGTGEGNVFRKLPGEDTWYLVFESPDRSTITMLYEHPDGTIYVSDDGVVAKSADGETNWEVIDSQNLWVRSMTVADDGKAYFGSGFGIYTMGADDKFKEVHFDASYPFGKWIYSMMKGPDGALYAGTGREIYKTIQYGNDTIIWAKEVVSVPDPMPTFYAMAMKSNGDLYAATAFGLYANYADDGNASWVEVAGSYIKDRSIRTLAIGKNDRLFINFNGRGVIYSDDDTNWVEVAGTEEINTRPGIYYDAVGDAVILGSWNGVWASPEQNDYSFQKIGLPSKITKVLSDHPKLFVIEDRQHVLESSDGGDTWNPILSFTEGVITDYTERAHGARYAAVWGGALGLPGILMYDENEFGDIWFSIGLPKSVTEIHDILLSSEDILLAVTNSGLYSINPVTYDAELLWSQQDITQLTEDSQGWLYASTARGLYVSKDHGKTWSVHLLEDAVINSVTLVESELYVATESALYYISALDTEPVQLGDDDILQISQSFQSVVVDRAGHVYVVCDDGIFYGETMNGPWETRPDGLNTVRQFTNLQLYNDIVYLGTEFGLYKHQSDNQAIILLSGIGSFVYDGQVHGDPQATTIPPGLTVNITFTAGSDAGSYAVHAVIEDDYYQGEVESAVVIRKATQTINFPSVADKYNTDEAFTLQGTSNVGLPVNFQIISGPATLSNGNLITLSGEPGIVEIKATQPGSQNYFAAKPVTRIFEVLYNPITDTDDDPLSKNLSVFPVPADKTLHIISEFTSLRTLTISDVTGRVLKAIQLDRDTYRHDLDVASYPAGILLLTVTNDRGEKVTHRIQIIH